MVYEHFKGVKQISRLRLLNPHALPPFFWRGGGHRIENMVHLTSHNPYPDQLAHGKHPKTRVPLKRETKML